MAFHPYSQIILVFCNIHKFGPPPGYSPAFSLFMNRSLSFGSYEKNRRRAFHTCFRFVSVSQLKHAFFIYSPTHYAKGISLHTTHIECGALLRMIVYNRFLDSISLHVFLVLFTFLTRYLFSIGHKMYLDLEGGSSIFEKGMLSLLEKKFNGFYRTFTLFRRFCQYLSNLINRTILWSFPGSFTITNGISVDFFLEVLRCFSSLNFLYVQISLYGYS